jgi:hypothetical protein
MFVDHECLLFQGGDIHFERSGKTFEGLDTGLVTALDSLDRPDIESGHLGQLFLR